MNYYSNEVLDVFKDVDSSPEGLSQSQVEVRQTAYGRNELVQPPKPSTWQKLMGQLSDPMIIMLLVAAAISGVTAAIENESMADVFIILFVVVLNSILGVYQESKAEEAIEALKQMTAATSKVKRDGKKVTIPSAELVVGDVIYLEAGDAVPADGRIIASASMKIEESSLTGESEPVSKFINMLHLTTDDSIPLGDRKNMCYMGSTVVYGHGEAVITNTGMTTEMGKIAGALSEAENEQTPLQKKLSELSNILTKLVVGICVFIFIFTLIRNGDFSGGVILDTFMIAVSLAVAAIPEGLVAVVTIVLSIGVTNMSKRNAVIRKLTAVETLGSAQVICSDKTGTLTQNKMTVVKTYGEDENRLAIAMALCNDAVIDDSKEITDKTKVAVLGEPTEAALVAYAATIDQNKNDLTNDYPRVGEAPFDSSRKMMSTVHRFENKILQFTKGAPDEVLKQCSRIYRNNEIVPLTDEIRQEIMDANNEMAGNALRVLAGAMKEHEGEPASYEAVDLEKDLVFLGLMGMIDPIRPEVIGAIEECREAGITPVMITGDHRITAIAIAKQLGILTDESQAITGSQLDDISEEDFETEIENIKVYARVQPEHKTRIVKMWKKKGKITAMTGDGVNDAPSIKSADIGVGMGITGTDVTKNVADMVLADDNFATIVSAVEEGRRIYDNILKVIQFLLSANMSEVLSIFFATLLGFKILEPVHILWINLITDSIPALALGVEKAEGDLMKRKPRDPNSSIFSEGMGINIGYQGILISILTIASYFIGHYMESGLWEIAQSPDGVTMAFLTLSMTEIFHSLNMRSRFNSIFTMKSQNIFLLLSMVIALVLTTVVIEVPFLAEMFEFEVISLKEYAVAIGLGLLIIPSVEIVKFFQRKYHFKGI
jgi:Ca2+-transporting ATPase